MYPTNITNSFLGLRSFKKIITVLSLLLLGVNGVMGQNTSNFNDGYITVFKNASISGSTGSAIVLEEYLPSASSASSPNFSVNLPNTAAPGSTGIVAGGTTSSNGAISRSENGRYILVPGWSTNSTISSAAIGVANTANLICAVRPVNGTGTIGTGITGTSNWFTGANDYRGATSDDGTNYWVTGNSLGVRYTNNGTTLVTLPSGTTSSYTSSRTVNIFNGNLYYSTGSGSPSVGIYQIGSGKPTTASQTATMLVAPTPYSFSISPDGLTIYAVNSSLIVRYTYNGTSWSSASAGLSLGTATGLVVDWTGYTFSVSGTNGAVIYASNTPSSGNSTIVRANDNGTSAMTGTIIASVAVTGNIFKQIAFSPIKQTISKGANTPATGNLTNGSSNTVLFQLNLSADEGNSTVKKIVLATAGTVVLGTDISNFRILNDANNDGVADAGEISAGFTTIGTISGSNITFSGLSLSSYIAQGSSNNFLIIGDVAAGATAARTFIPSIASNNTINSIAYTSNLTNAGGSLVTMGTSTNAPIGNTLTILAPPTITTTATPASITHNTASSGGQTISGSNITSKGVVWSTSTAPTVSLSTITNDGTGTTDFSSSLTSLSPQTFYYIRAYATNASGTGYGDQKTVRTLSAPTTVQASSLSATASSPSNIDLSWTAATFPSTGASASGYVLLRAASPNTPTLGNSNGASPTAGSNTLIVSSTIASSANSFSSSGLAPSTQYNYLIIPFTWDGTNASTYNYLTTSAPTANATTQAGSIAPVLVTNTSTSITDVTATFNGDVTNDGGSAITERGFVYSISDATPTIGEAGVTQQTVSGTTGVFSYNASSLSVYTVYYTQAYATNSAGTTYGGVNQFTTLKSEPSVQATSLVFSSITSAAFNSAFTAAIGSPDGYIVLSSTSTSLSSNPIDGTTYTAGNSLGGGTVISVGSSLSGIANTSLSSGTTYYIFVYAYNNSGSNINYLSTSPLSASTITLSAAPATPTFSSVNTTSFTIDWTATSGASSYRLDLSTVSNFSSFISGYQDLTVSSTSQAVSGLTENTLYYARIRADNASGTSANSSSGNSPTLSNPPTISTASSITTSNLTSNWTAPASQGSVATTYAIELSLLSNDFSSPVAAAASISSSLSSYQFTGLSDGTTYYYRVKAVNSAGSSAWSSVSAGATTLPGSISLTALGTASTEDFNTLASTGSSSALPSGWYLSESGTNANSIYTAGTGSVSSGDTYSFGINSDLAFGGVQTGSLIPTNGAKFKNNSGSTINNLFVSYTGETWRVGTASRVDQLDFQYSTDATSLTSGNWIDVNILDYANPGQAVGSGSLQHSSSISDVITGLSIANGASFMIRWLDFNASGSDDGMGIDDFSIKPCGTTSAPTAANQSFCSSSPTVANLTATGTSIQWYAASSGGSALATNTALVNNTTYYASQTVGGCESVTRASSIITLSSNNTASAASSSPSLSVNTPLTAITHITTGATGIGTATALPAGVTAAWASNTITISGTPTASGNFSYSIPLTGGCGTVNATGTINVVASCPTDLNNNGITDVNDFIIFAPAFGTSNVNSPTDFNSDGVTDVNDFIIFAPAYNVVCI